MAILHLLQSHAIVFCPSKITPKKNNNATTLARNLMKIIHLYACTYNCELSCWITGSSIDRNDQARKAVPKLKKTFVEWLTFIVPHHNCFFFAQRQWIFFHLICRFRLHTCISLWFNDTSIKSLAIAFYHDSCAPIEWQKSVCFHT